MYLNDYLSIDHITAGGIFAATDFSLSIMGTVLNVIILVTIKNSPTLSRDLDYIMFASLAAANIIITAFVKLLSTVLVGHAVAKNAEEVSFQFCSVYIMFHRLTWFIFPATILTLSWSHFWSIIQYRFVTSESFETMETLSMGRKSLVEEEGVLTRRHNILKEREIVRIMKSFQADKADCDSSNESVLSPKSKRTKKSARKSSGQQEKETINLARAWKSKATEKKTEVPANEKRKLLKEKSKSIDDTLETSPTQLERQHSHSCFELHSEG